MIKPSDLFGGIPDRMHSIAGECEKHGAQDAWVLKTVSAWHCPVCADDAHIAATRRAFYDERCETLRRVSTVPAKYVGKKFTPGTDDHRAVRLTAREFMEIAIAGQEWCSLVLSGEAGTGKTLLASEMIESFIHKTMKQARYVTATGMVAEIHMAYRSEIKTEAGEIKRFADYDLLVIDEIDLIRANDNSQGLLTEVINARYNASKATIVITNKPRNELVKYVGSRVDDRLCENGYLALFAWSSFRRQIAQ